jgi:hypothetical protein
MGRARDISKVFSSNSTLSNSYLTLASASTTYAPVAAGGLVQINPSGVTSDVGSSSKDTNGTVSFSSIGALFINGIFSSTYDNYKIIFNTTSSSTGNNITFRFVTNGVENSNAVYRTRSFIQSDSGTPGAFGIGNSQTFLYLCPMEVIGGGMSIDIYRPFLSDDTYISGTANNKGYGTVSAGCFEGNTSFTGVRLSVDSGNISGSCQIYGYKK